MRDQAEDQSSTDWRIVYGGIGFHIVSAAIFSNIERFPSMPEGNYPLFFLPLLAIGGFVMTVVVCAASLVPPQQMKEIMIAHGMPDQSADKLAWRLWIVFTLSCYLSAFLCSIIRNWVS